MFLLTFDEVIAKILHHVFETQCIFWPNLNALDMIKHTGL